MSNCIEKGNRKETEKVSNAFAYAKEALSYIAKFRTPPTPEVYEVWYRYSEGELLPLRDQLSYAVNDVQEANFELLQQIHQQFFAKRNDDELSCKLGEDLSLTIGDVESIISDQQSAQDELKTTVGTASDRIRDQEVTPETLQACVASVLAGNQRMQARLEEMTKRLDESRHQVNHLRDSYLESQRKMMIDPLTGVGNRLFFDMMMKNAFAHRKQTNRHCFLLLIDLDKFKYVNDNFGHSTGDLVLKFVATHLERIAVDASLARYGGDEFAVFIDTEKLSDGVEYGEAICHFFAKNKLTVNETGECLGELTTSIGGSLLRAEDTASSWFERADRLLYSAKSAGRNRAMVERKIK